MIRENARLKEELETVKRSHKEERREIVLSLLPVIDSMERLFAGVEDENIKGKQVL